MRSKLLPLFSTSILYALVYFISRLKFDITIEFKAIPYDYAAQLLFAYLLYALSKRVSIFLIIQTLWLALLYIGNAVKISFFGGPIMPDDVYALQALLLILEGWQFFAAAIPLAAIACLLCFNFSMRHWSAYLASLISLSFVLTLIYQPGIIVQKLDKHFGHSVWDQRSNYIWRGATIYIIQESARYFVDSEVGVDQDTALTAANRLLSNKVSKKTDKAFTPRNIHLILLESFWDPNRLKKAKYNENPLSPEFRKIWKASNYTQALTPVFGGYTANSEFEILCGFPVVRDSVKFERRLLNDVPCLPHLLADEGYKTIASHPNVPVFWNRVNAYRRMGFQHYFAKEDFLLDDMNRNFLADSSLYKQVLDKISNSLQQKQPVLNYIVTYFGHWNYPLSESRPSKITSPSKVEEVSTYANTVYYKSRELMAFIKELRQRDPEGIIVFFGDHLPFLGEHFAGYTDSEVLTPSRSNFTVDMFKFYVSTPMVIIDGKRGLVEFDTLPLYRVPKLLLNLLNYQKPTIMDYTDSLPNLLVRPLPGLHFNILNNKKLELCTEPPFVGSCQTSGQWLTDVLQVSEDLFLGQQYTRPKHVELNSKLEETYNSTEKTEAQNTKPD